MWASILASEANKPGTVSKRTVDLAATLDKSDAQLFTNLCTFAWVMGRVTLFVPDSSHEVFEDKGINFGSLTHLNDIGLVTHNMVSAFTRRALPNNFVIFYYGHPIILELPDGKNELPTGRVLFTKSGEQLAEICGSKASPGIPAEVTMSRCLTKVSGRNGTLTM